MNRSSERPTAFRAILCADFQLQTSVSQNGRLLDSQKIEPSCVDNSTSSHAKDARKKEDTGEKHRSNPKAERGRYPAKSIHYGIVARLATLRVFRKAAG
jgi:hypothetical protein